MAHRQTAPDPLHSAAKDGNPKTILEILNNGTHLNTRSKSNWTALQVAAAHNKLGAVETLLNRGAKIELTKENDLTALHLSAANGHVEIVKFLLRNGADMRLKTLDNGFHCLHLAAQSGRNSVVELLVQHTDNIMDRGHQGHTALHCAVFGGHAECVCLLARAGASVEAGFGAGDETPLMGAVISDNSAMIWTLLHLGVNVDAVQRDGRTAVHLAAYLGKVDAVEILMTRGALLDTMDNHGYNVLRFSLERKHLEVALALLRNRIKVRTSSTPHSDTALHLAAGKGYLEVAQQLISRSADLHACDADGDTPLQWAVEAGHDKMAKCLLRHGADVNKQNSKLEKPF